MNSTLNIGIIGYGYWGPNLLRNFNALDICNVVAVADGRKNRLDLAKRFYPGVRCHSSADDVIDAADIDAVVVATPVYSHFDLCYKALSAGKHVLVEKPMTSRVSEALELINISGKKNLVLMVDHTFLYTGAVKKIKQYIEDSTIGKPTYYDSTRINLGLFQPDVNVLWDLAPHDISILSHLINEVPVSVNATGISHTGNGIENVAFMTVNYQSDFIAHLNCSWSSPVKIRRTLIGGSEKMLLYDDIEPTEKLRVYDSGHDFINDEEKNRILVDYRYGDVHIPKIETTEALYGVASDFVDAVIHQKTPLADDKLGLKVVQILEAAQQSIKNRGAETFIK